MTTIRDGLAPYLLVYWSLLGLIDGTRALAQRFGLGGW